MMNFLANEVAPSKNLRTLDLSYCSATSDEWVRFLEILQMNKNLVNINLSHNQIESFKLTDISEDKVKQEAENIKI